VLASMLEMSWCLVRVNERRVKDNYMPIHISH
jgi:hypothetical protein